MLEATGHFSPDVSRYRIGARSARMFGSALVDRARSATGHAATVSGICRDLVDGASRTRTGDLLGAIQALSQLSYSPAVGPV
jgi:hypothetical protein